MHVFMNRDGHSEEFQCSIIILYRKTGIKCVACRLQFCHYSKNMCLNVSQPACTQICMRMRKQSVFFNCETTKFGSYVFKTHPTVHDIPLGPN